MPAAKFEMGKKRSRQQQSSNTPVPAVDSSESGDGAVEKAAPIKQICSHVAKSIDGNQIKKNITLYLNGKKPCAHCKEGNEEVDKSLQGTDDFWICLRCGARTCTAEHSSLHYDVPRSDSHALSVKIPAFLVWCHACKTDIPSGYSKKLKTCITSVEQLYNRQINLQPLSLQESNNSFKNKDGSTDKGKKPIDDGSVPSTNDTRKVANSAPSVRGLTNLGNTCFFNSVLQCLAQTPGLVEAIREMEAPDQQVNIVLKSGATLIGKLGQWDGLSECLADTLVKLQSGGPVVSPDRLLSLLTKKQTQFQGYRQHDAHELFTYLIDSVRMADHKRYRKLILSEFGLYGKQEHQDVSEETTKRLKAIDYEVAELITFAPEKVFKGRLVNRIQCQECQSIKTFEESFLDLSLPIVPDKPQPPCMRRKGGHQQYLQNQGETVQEENKTTNGNAAQTMSKSQMKKERRLQRQKNRKNNNATVIKQQDLAQPLVEEQLKEDIDLEKQQDSDVEGDVEDNSDETNCGSKIFSTMVGAGNGGEVVESALVNCGNQGADSNESLSTSMAEREKSVEQVHALTQQEEEGDPPHIIEDLLCAEKSEDCSMVTGQPTVASSSLFLPTTREMEEEKCVGKSNQCCESSEAQVTAWLNTSNLTDVPDRDVSPESHAQVTGCEVENRLSPQVYSLQPNKLPPDEASRSSFLTGTQETQESGYCSEKLGCAESPQREGSPCSLDGLSPAWTGVEGALSSRSDVSIEQVFNNTAIAEEDETREIAAASHIEMQSLDSTSIKLAAHLSKKGSWMKSGHPPAHVRRRAPSPPPAVLNTPISSCALDSAVMCSKWVEESSTTSNFEVKADVPSIEKLPLLEGAEHQSIGNNLESILGDIVEEEGDVIYGPLNKDQMFNGYAEESADHDLCPCSAQKVECLGFTARPASPCEEKDDESCNAKCLFVNTESSPEVIKTDGVITDPEANISRTKGSEHVRLHGGGARDSDMSCACNQTQRQDHADSCCLHISLAQSAQVELMTGCNKIVCDTCSSGNEDGKSVYTNSTKQTLISQAPPALVIHLKRFQVQMMTCRKLCRHVSFPFHLDLTPYSVPSQHILEDPKDSKHKSPPQLLYSLYGVVEHGGTMNGGHYVAYVKIAAEESSNLWYCISDSHVSQVSESRVLSAQAYLLFYKRMTT